MTKPDKRPPHTLELEGVRDESEAVAKGRAALRPEINALLVIDTYKTNLMGKDVDTGMMLASLQKSVQEIKDGDLSHAEAMLLNQATALQTMFSSLAIRASNHDYLPNYQALMGMAFKAQSQSRATLQTLAELKNPRHPTFVKQANIAPGPQQVNSGMALASPVSRMKKRTTTKSKLLEQDHDQAHWLDAGTAGTTGGNDPAVEALGKVYRPSKRGR